MLRLLICVEDRFTSLNLWSHRIEFLRCIESPVHLARVVNYVNKMKRSFLVCRIDWHIVPLLISGLQAVAPLLENISLNGHVRVPERKAAKVG